MTHSEHAPAGSPLRLQAVSVAYDSQSPPLTVVERIDLDVRGGEFVAILGPSGCGKSTLLRVLAGLQDVSAGTVTIAGKRLQGSSRDIGVVFQDATLLPWKTVLENICLPGKIMGLRPSYVQARATLLLDMLRLAGFENYYPHQLSGGMRQRVGIARGLLHDPSILLMDEPFGALDALTRSQITEELQQLWMATGKTIFFVTHSIREAVFLADRIVVLSARPARVADIVHNSLPRPRNGAGMATREAVGHVDYLSNLFQVGGAIA